MEWWPPPPPPRAMAVQPVRRSAAARPSVTFSDSVVPFILPASILVCRQIKTIDHAPIQDLEWLATSRSRPTDAARPNRCAGSVGGGRHLPAQPHRAHGGIRGCRRRQLLRPGLPRRTAGTFLQSARRIAWSAPASSRHPARCQVERARAGTDPGDQFARARSSATPSATT